MQRCFCKEGAVSRAEIPRSRARCPTPTEISARWGTWLKAVYYSATNIQQVEEVLTFGDGDAMCIASCKRMIRESVVKSQLAFVPAFCHGIPEAMFDEVDQRLNNRTTFEIVDSIESCIQSCIQSQIEFRTSYTRSRFCQRKNAPCIFTE